MPKESGKSKTTDDDDEDDQEEQQPPNISKQSKNIAKNKTQATPGQPYKHKMRRRHGDWSRYVTAHFSAKSLTERGYLGKSPTIPRLLHLINIFYFLFFGWLTLFLEGGIRWTKHATTWIWDRYSR